ncbi:hypothetical protein C0995_005265 [Termitomyces sp. Mi166|nr:hypothetical protein C0995_005265 [Termitomyces sp. Mi166\
MKFLGVTVIRDGDPVCSRVRGASAPPRTRRCREASSILRKDKSAFTNLVPVIPILDGERGDRHDLDDIIYHVGFQIYLPEQPNAITRQGVHAKYTPSWPGSSLHRRQYPSRQGKKQLPYLKLLENPPSTAILPLRSAQLLHQLYHQPGQHPPCFPLRQTTAVPHPLRDPFLYIASTISHILLPFSWAVRYLTSPHLEDVVPLARQHKESSTS